MSEIAADPDPARVLAPAEANRILVARRTSAPPPRPRAVSRMGLIDRARASGCRIVAVTAPAGYGKTTLLAEWATRETRAVAWVSLDRFVDNPASLLSLVASACSEFSPQAAEVVSEMRDTGGLALGRSAPVLAAALARTSTRFTLFVDDLHTVDSPGCHDVLEVVVNGIPDGSQIVIASRHEQRHLARQRVAGQLFELGAEDLRLDTTGARTIFTTAGADVAQVNLAALLQRCEGWPAGLYLCALIARSGGDALSVSGDDRFIADYLYRECLARLPEDTQQFLRRTAVLEQLCGPLCDAVLDASDSHARLRELETLNLFLVPLDRRRGWYRYHSLFREFLLAELVRRDSPKAAELQKRAAAWCEANGQPASAIEYLLAAGEREHSIHLVTEMALPTYQSGQVAVVSRWLSELGAAAVESYPPLAVLACWKALLMGESREAERWASVLDRIEYPGEDKNAALAFESSRAMIRAAMCAHGAQRALEDADFAMASEPPWSPWRDQAAHLYASALLLIGNAAGARDAFVEGSAAGALAGNPDSIILCEAELAVLAIDDGDWSDAAIHADIALNEVEANRMDGYSTAALAFAVAARVALHDDDLSSAERLLARGMRARVLCTHVLPFLSLRVRLQLAKAHAAKGDKVTATALADEMADLLRRRPDVGLLAEEITAHRDQLTKLPDRADVPPLSPAELRLLPYLQTHLTLADIGQRLFISRNTVSTQVTSIYRKLGAQTRRTAVQRATELHLLGN